MENVEIKKQIQFVLMSYMDEEGNQCEMFQAYESGVKLYERDYKQPVNFDDCVHDYYNFNYMQYYYPPTNISIS